ncbi:hypothetical protein [Massilia sp. TS11]|uniref:hypothetical protein n=1 Tax=Massilia sp. TS11 TaxID=2908003 RepID=UPI0027D9C511|nr:hypothetical protein [Massilia sp. TS11]
METIGAALSWASRRLGLETVDRFPPGHAYARTRWDKAYFDIASDVAPEEIERRIVAAIDATPSVFAHIEHPTPRMQRALIAQIGARMRRACGVPGDLLGLLIQAFQSPHTREALPGLRQAISATQGLEPAQRAQALLAFLAEHAAQGDVIEAAGAAPKPIK